MYIPLEVAVLALGAALALGVALGRTQGASPGSGPTPKAGSAGAPSDAASSAQAELLRAIFDHAPMAVLVYGETGKISFSNREARLLFSNGGELEGENFLRLIERAPEPLRSAVLRQSDALFTVSGAAQLETFSLARRELNWDGEPQTLLMVKELTSELGRQEIDVWKNVIRIINHELNNSLAPILSMVHTARFILSDPQQLHQLELVFETIEERARHLAGFLEGYARFARLPRPSPELVDWGKFLDGLRLLYPKAKICESPGGVGYFDLAQMQQVLINLLKNAFEASSADPEVELSVRVAGDGSATLSVSDRGRGMSAEVLKNASTPFFTTKQAGSGLGLALSREVVEAHRGKLTILRRAGGGIEVSCWLPGRPTPGRQTLAPQRTTTLTLTRN